MPAKDYQIAVSPLTGTVFITKVSKTNKNLMLSDRVEFPKGHFYQIIEQFAKTNIAEGYSTLEVKDIKGNLVFELCLPNPKLAARHKKYRQIAEDILSATNGMSDEDILRMPGIPTTLISLAKMVQELTTV